MNFCVARARRRARGSGVLFVRVPDGSEGLGGGRPERVRKWDVTASGIWILLELRRVRVGRVGKGGGGLTQETEKVKKVKGSEERLVGGLRFNKDIR